VAAGSLDEHQIVIHEFVIGELACGSLHDRREPYGLLKRLPPLPLAHTKRCWIFWR